MNKIKLGTLAALISGIAYGIAPVLAKIAYHSGLNVITVLLLRFLGVVLIIWLYKRIYWGDRKLSARMVVKLILFGALVYAGMSGLYMLSFTTIPASLACILLYLYPSFVAVSAAFLRMEKLTRQKGIALVLATLGLVLLLRSSFVRVNLAGIIYGIGAAMLYATYLIIGTNIMKKIEPIVVTMYIMMGATISYGLAGLVSRGILFDISLGNWVLMASIVIFTVFGLVFLWISVRLVGPVKASIISTVEAPVTMFLSALIFRERMTATQFLGSMMIIAAVIILQYSAAKEKDEGECWDITSQENMHSHGI
ncbi:Drug/metabolite transporter [Moorella glycerini]|uniref:Threonine and homoserine efflux system n=1 Tax=Neomoorella stamsii TaxID=1266720 RepID=A0A9X7IZZ2_9FIRM|nr:MULTISPECIES: DMT family transporter [Moorella]PRR68851.1 threonine and homoserine efflux system [Moorella stamsii]CEP67472.1 Drug/metabolite transporter [Moorella glycerini]